MNQINIESLFHHVAKYDSELRRYAPNSRVLAQALKNLLEKGETHFLLTAPENDIIKLFLMDFDGINDHVLQIISKGKLRSSLKNLKNNIIASIIYSFKDTNNRFYLINYLPIHKNRRWSAILKNDARIVESYNKDLTLVKGQLDSLQQERDAVDIEIKKLNAVAKNIDKQNIEKSNEYKNHEEKIQSYENIIFDKVEEIKHLDAKKLSFNELMNEREEKISKKEKEISEENQKLLKQKVEQSLPGYIRKTQALLKAKERSFSRMGKNWSYLGVGSILIAIYCGIFFTIYSFDFINLNENLEWKYLLINLFKGSLVVGVFLYIAQHAFNISNAYVHESIQRSDKRHAINFGELFLKIYGSGLQREELLKVFANWNISTDSAFKKIPQASMHKELANLLSNFKPDSIGKEKKPEAD